METCIQDSLPSSSKGESDLETATMRAVSRRLIPFLFVLYVVCFLDRVNVGFASLQMNRDLGFGPEAYGFGAGIFFIGYSLCEVPSNLILARMGARRWIARIMVTWGLIAAAMMFVRGPLSFYLLRFVLGVAEAGFFPGMIYYLSNWFPADARARAIARFMTAVPLSGVIGGPVSGVLLGLNGRLGLAGWQWLFVLEGLPAVLLGFTVFRFLPDHPGGVTWLDPKQRKWLVEHLVKEKDERVAPHAFGVIRALSSRVVWQLGLLAFLSLTFGYNSLGLWLPQIVRGFSGLNNLQVGFVSAVPNLVATVAMVLFAAHSDRTGDRCLHIAAASAVAATGFLGCALFKSPVFGVSFLSLAAAGLKSGHGPFWPLPSKFLTGAAAAGGIALINSLSSLSGFVGPYAIGLLNSVSGDFRSGMLLLALVPLGGALLALRLRHANVLREPTKRPEYARCSTGGR